MKNFIKYVNRIQKDFPRFNISSIQKIGEGDDSKAFCVNEKYVFRFPKNKGAKEQLEIEIHILPIIKPYLNLAIPDFKFIPPGNNYTGYKIISGTPLTSEIYNSLKKNTRKSVQYSIAWFLMQLHQIDLSLIKDGNPGIMNLKEEYAENFEQAKNFIYPNISKSKRKIISQLFSNYLDDVENFEYTQALIHNDFSKDHILFDTVNRQITGIIDFGDVALGDPAYDFMYLLDEFGEEFLNGILKIYKPVDKFKLMKKLIFFSLANKVQIIMMEKENNDSEALKEAYSSLDYWIEKWSKRVGNS